MGRLWLSKAMSHHPDVLPIVFSSLTITKSSTPALLDKGSNHNNGLTRLNLTPARQPTLEDCIKLTMSSVPSQRSEPYGKTHKKKANHAEFQSRGAALYRSTLDGEQLRSKCEGLKLLATNPSGIWHEALGVAGEIQAPKDAGPKGVAPKIVASTAHSGSSRGTHGHRTHRGASIYDDAHYAEDFPANVRSPVYRDSPPAYDTLYLPSSRSQYYEVLGNSAYEDTSSAFKNASIRKSQDAVQESFAFNNTPSISQQGGTRKTQNASEMSLTYDDTSPVFSNTDTRKPQHASQEPSELDGTSSSFRQTYTRKTYHSSQKPSKSELKQTLVPAPVSMGSVRSRDTWVTNYSHGTNVNVPLKTRGSARRSTASLRL
jgi:hypothetical protein